MSDRLEQPSQLNQAANTAMDSAMEHLLSAQEAAQTSLREVQSAFGDFRTATAVSTNSSCSHYQALSNQGETEFRAVIDEAGLLVAAFSAPLVQKLIGVAKSRQNGNRSSSFTIEQPQIDELSEMIAQLIGLPESVEKAREATELGLHAQTLLMTVARLVEKEQRLNSNDTGGKPI